MLIISLVFSAIVLTASLQRNLISTAGLGLGISVVSLGVGCILPFVALQTVLLLLIFAVCARWQLSDRARRLSNITASLLPYAIYACYLGFLLPALSEVYPYESIEARLPKRELSPPRLPGSMESELFDLGSDVYRAGATPYFGDQRGHQLMLIHENRVQAFVESFGFGVGRLAQLGRPISQNSLTMKLRTTESPVAQPGSKPVEWLSAGANDRIGFVDSSDALRNLHKSSFLDFVYPPAFGYFKDRRNVAGFRPHQFSQIPAVEASLKVETLELVGLVVHEEPVAYISEKLPRMDVLRTAPIRALDNFEKLGLANLREGEMLFVAHQGDYVRMLGAIRATRQCTSCHDCERGTLLGAFSYILAKSSR